MSKNVLYAANTSTQSVAAGSIVNFGNIVRRNGCAIGMSGGNPTCQGIGFYDVDVSLTFTGTGTITFTIYKDGNAIPGATATITGVADTTYSVCIPATFRDCCCFNSTITVEVSGVTASVSNASIRVEKL